MGLTDKAPWGPWSCDIVDHHERKAQFRSLAAICYIMRVDGGMPPDRLIEALRKAEFCQEWADKAKEIFDLLPTLHQRHVIALFNSINYRVTQNAKAS